MSRLFLRDESIYEKNFRTVCQKPVTCFILDAASVYPIALEGALKLKEISYIHAEGYAAGELKHGPIALIDENVPVIVVAPNDQLFDKTLSNMQEVAARGGKVIMLTDHDPAKLAGDVAENNLPFQQPMNLPIRWFMRCRYNFWLITPLCLWGQTSISRAIWQNPSQWNRHRT